MLRKSVLEKIVAVFSIFTLTFANFAFVTKSYAATIFETVFCSSRTEDENVKFSNLYVSDFYVDELNEYFSRQLNTIRNYKEDDDDFEIDSDDCDNETEMEFKYAED